MCSRDTGEEIAVCRTLALWPLLRLDHNRLRLLKVQGSVVSQRLLLTYVMGFRD